MAINVDNSDSHLVQELNDGNTEAFNQLFYKYANKLYGFALKYLKSKEDTEGLVQDVFLKIWENRSNLKKEASFKAYLFTIAYHKMCHIFRMRIIYLEIIENNKKFAAKKFEQEQQIEYSFILNQIDTLINRLPEKQRQIFIKSRKEGKTTREIAKEMNLAPGTVDNNISSAIKFLKKLTSAESFELLLFFFILFQH